MEICSETGFFIIMDPHYLQLGDMESVQQTNFTQNPRKAATKLESILFPDGATGKIGLIELPGGAGNYRFDESEVSFWDVENHQKQNRTIFGVEFGSYIIFDIIHIPQIFNSFYLNEFQSKGEAAYFIQVEKKIDNQKANIIWRQSQVGIGDGWHEVSWDAFSRA